MALKMGEYIKAEFPTVRVIYTRETDVFVELNRRSEIANEAKADLFISIHCNSAPTHHAVGAETFVMGLNASQSNLEVALRENAVIIYEDDYTTKYEGYDPNSPESFIIFSLMQNVFLNQSLEFAGLVQDEFASRVRRFDRGVKQERFLVLYKSSMPAVLIELGFLSNAKEEAFLLSEDGQALMASAIYRAFKRYKRNWDLRAMPYMMLTEDERQGRNSTKTPTPPRTKEASAKLTPKRIYRIQLATVTRPVEKGHPLRRNFKDLQEKKEGKVYRYYTHETGSREEAERSLTQIKRNYKDAFIVTFEGEQRVANP